jgi:hypothetical protein
VIQARDGIIKAGDRDPGYESPTLIASRQMAEAPSGPADAGAIARRMRTRPPRSGKTPLVVSRCESLLGGLPRRRSIGLTVVGNLRLFG